MVASFPLIWYFWWAGPLSCTTYGYDFVNASIRMWLIEFKDSLRQYSQVQQETPSLRSPLLHYLIANLSVGLEPWRSRHVWAHGSTQGMCHSNERLCTRFSAENRKSNKLIHSRRFMKSKKCANFDKLVKIAFVPTDKYVNWSYNRPGIFSLHSRSVKSRKVSPTETKFQVKEYIRAMEFWRKSLNCFSSWKLLKSCYCNQCDTETNTKTVSEGDLYKHIIPTILETTKFI